MAGRIGVPGARPSIQEPDSTCHHLSWLGDDQRAAACNAPTPERCFLLEAPVSRGLADHGHLRAIHCGGRTHAHLAGSAGLARLHCNHRDVDCGWHSPHGDRVRKRLAADPSHALFAGCAPVATATAVRVRGADVGLAAIARDAVAVCISTDAKLSYTRTPAARGSSVGASAHAAAASAVVHVIAEIYFTAVGVVAVAVRVARCAD